MTHAPVVVTGAGGFIGRSVCHELTAQGLAVRALSRRNDHPGLTAIDYANPAALRIALDGCSAVIHLAARAHVVDELDENPEQAFRDANVALSLALAKAAIAAGVPRFVFVSSIGAVCSTAPLGTAVKEDAPCRPTTSYGRSKRLAEQVLSNAFEDTGTSLVIVRPPLVHGAGAPGNLERLRRWIETGRPLPLGSVTNRRSLVHVSNLARALFLCATAPSAAGRTYHIRDPRDRSTPELIRELARSCRRPPLLFDCPPSLLAVFGRLSGKADAVAQITASLQVDDTRLRAELGFRPEDRIIEA